MVERPPPRPIHDDFGVDPLLGDEIDGALLNAPLSPPPPSVGSPSISSPIFANNSGPTSSIGEQQKPPPRPYIPRRTSSTSNSIMGVISPTLGNIGSTPQNLGLPEALNSPVVGSGQGSPNALTHAPAFVKRTRSLDSGSNAPSG